MADYTNDSIAGLFRSILDDARELMRDELDLMRAEVREEIRGARSAGLAFGGAAIAATIGVGLLAIALAGALAAWLGWPAWAGYGTVAILLFAGALIAAQYGRRRAAAIGGLPKSREALKENLSWLQNKSPLR